MMLSRLGFGAGGLIAPGIAMEDLPRGGSESVTAKPPVLNGESFDEYMKQANLPGWQYLRMNPDWSARYKK
jgi:hypothetical protein